MPGFFRRANQDKSTGSNQITPSDALRQAERAYAAAGATADQLLMNSDVLERVIDATLQNYFDLARSLDPNGTVSDAIALADSTKQDADWEAMPLDRLVTSLGVQLVGYGLRPQSMSIDRLNKRYKMLVARSDPRVRLTLLSGLSRMLPSHENAVCRFLPFILADLDIAVISSATLEFALQLPLSRNDPMTGPTAAMRLADALGTTPEDDQTRGAIYAGVLLLGDWRILPLIDGCWRRLGLSGRAAMALCHAQFAYDLVVEFFLRWMESGTEEEMGFPAAALRDFPTKQRGDGFIRRIERTFPVNPLAPMADNETVPQVRVLKSLTFAEYAAAIEPRLRALGKRETYDPVVPHVLRAWELPA